MNRLTWVAAAFLALAPLAIVYCRPDDPMPPREPIVAGAALPDVGLTVAGEVTRTGEIAARRNLFGFVEAPAVRVPAKAPTVVQPPIPPGPSLTLGVTKAPEPPPFSYRYLGRFGPDAAPFAVFSANGNVVNARAGNVIDGTFVVRSINLESVDIGFVGFDATRRVGVGE